MSARARLLPTLLPSRWTTRVPCGQPWNVRPAQGRQQTVLDDVPTPTDQMMQRAASGDCRPETPASKGLGVPSVYYPPCSSHAVSPSPTPRPGTPRTPDQSLVEVAIFLGTPVSSSRPPPQWRLRRRSAILRDRLRRPLTRRPLPRDSAPIGRWPGLGLGRARYRRKQPSRRAINVPLAAGAGGTSRSLMGRLPPSSLPAGRPITAICKQVII